MGKPNFADVTSKEDIFGFSHFSVPSKSHKRKFAKDAKKNKIGTPTVSKVKSHKRKQAGTLKKKKIKKHTRRAHNWGPARPIKKQFIFRINRIHNVRNDKKAFKLFNTKGKGTFKSMKEMIKYVNKLSKVVSDGIIGGIQIYNQQYLEKVPQRSGRLRGELSKSILSNLPKTRFRFPYTMRVGVNLAYAGIVNNYTSDLVQIQHEAGNPKGNKGDPQSEYQYFDKFPRRMMDSVRMGLERQSQLENLEYDKVKWFLKANPDFL